MLPLRRHTLNRMARMARRGAGGAVALGLAGVLSACAGLGGPPTVTLSSRELQALAEKAFPVERRVLDLIEATVASPRLQLLPERNRVAAQLDLAARDRVLGGSWKGQLDFDAALRWEPSDQSVRLTQVHVRDLVLATRGATPRTAGEKLAAAVAQTVLEDFSLYRLPAERSAQMLKLGVTPSAVTVTSRGVEITFAAASSVR